MVGAPPPPLLLLLLLLLLVVELPPQVAAQEAQQCDAARGAGLTLSPAAAGQVRPECKAVTLIRHAQGTHNAAEQTTDLQPPDKVLLEEHSGRKYWDAALTAEGEAQALKLRDKLAAAPPRVEVVVTSTLRRALQTASIAFGEGPDLPPLSLPLPDPPFVATELCRERVADFTCDGRGEKSLLQKDFPTVDFSEVAHESDTMWADKEIAGGELRCRERAVRFAEWLMSRRERHLAVVSHGHFLRHLMAELQPKREESQIVRLKNAEMREMELCPADRGGASATSQPQTQLSTDALYEAEEAARQDAERAALEVDEEIRQELEALEHKAKAEEDREYQAHLEQSARRIEEHKKMEAEIAAAEDAIKQEEMKVVSSYPLLAISACEYHLHSHRAVRPPCELYTL
jgi:broad specificity phosphatase PhoE